MTPPLDVHIVLHILPPPLTPSTPNLPCPILETDLLDVYSLKKMSMVDWICAKLNISDITVERYQPKIEKFKRIRENRKL